MGTVLKPRTDSPPWLEIGQSRKRILAWGLVDCTRYRGVDRQPSRSALERAQGPRRRAGSAALGLSPAAGKP